MKNFRRSSLVLSAILTLLLLFSATAFAADEERAGSVSIGIKGWYNKFDYTDRTTATPITASTNYQLMVGPSIKGSYKNFFGGVTYLTTTSDYNLELSPTTVIEISRNDWDIIAGYMFHPRFGVFIGYKNIELGFQGGSRQMNGPAAGITGNMPLGNAGFALYGNASYMSLNDKWTYDTGTGPDATTSTGYNGELGVSYSFLQHASASLGYKHQIIKPESGDSDETYAGAAFSLDYRF
jgi:hypothetical protein